MTNIQFYFNTLNKLNIYLDNATPVLKSMPAAIHLLWLCCNTSQELQCVEYFRHLWKREVKLLLFQTC